MNLEEMPAWLTVKEKDLLKFSAQLCEEDAVEIGSAEGGSAIIIANELKNSKVYTIDPHKRGTINEFNKNMKKHNKEGKIVPLRMTSEQAYHKLKDHEFDLVFIDGDHSYDEVSYDLWVWKRTLKSGGLLLIHDLFGGGNDGVRKAFLDSRIMHNFKYLHHEDTLALFIKGKPTPFLDRVYVRYVSLFWRFIWYLRKAKEKLV